jgi:hydrogenase maturation factor
MLMAAPPAARERIAAQLSRHAATREGRVAGRVGDGPATAPDIETATGERRLLAMPAALGVPRLC